MNGLLNPWLRQSGTSAFLLVSLCLPWVVVAPGRAEEQLFTLMPAPGGGSPAESFAPSGGSSYASGVREGDAPIRSVPTPLTPIPYGPEASGGMSNSIPGALPNNEKLVPGKVYYFDSAGRPMKSPYDRGTTSARPARPKFDYSLAPIQPAARPMRNYVSRMAVAAEPSATSRNGSPGRLVRQDKVVSAESISSQRNRSIAKNDQSGQGSLRSGVRRVVTIENGHPRIMAIAPPAPKCPNCGNRKPIAAVATSGANVRR